MLDSPVSAKSEHIGESSMLSQLTIKLKRSITVYSKIIVITIDYFNHMNNNNNNIQLHHAFYHIVLGKYIRKCSPRINGLRVQFSTHVPHNQ